MKLFQSYHFILLVILLSLTTISVAVPKYAKAGCEDRCGNVIIPFPFGIGESCSLNKWYNVDCNSWTPYLSSLNQLEVLRVDLVNQTVTVKMQKFFNCSQTTKSVDLGSSPFLYSKSHNTFVYEGYCGNVVMMDNHGKVVTGCSTTCSNYTTNATTGIIDTSKCFGINCCERTIPQYLESYSMNLTGMERQMGGDEACGSAYLLDTNSYTERSNLSHQSYVPTSLQWILSDRYQDQVSCSIGQWITRVIDLGNGTQMNYWYCYTYFEGNPYLKDGGYGLDMVYCDLKCFYETKQNGFIEFIACLHGDFENELELPAELLPLNLLEEKDVWEVTDARGIVRFVTMERDDDLYAWSLTGTKWSDLIASVIDLDPKLVHFDQIGGNKFLVNFYTASGEEVDYGFTSGHVSKCVVLGCKDPRLYQPIPSEMMLNWNVNRNSKFVQIEFDGIVRNIGITFHSISKGKKIIGVSFTGDEWESLCISLGFSETKVLVVSSDEDVDFFVAKVMDGFVADPVKMFGCENPPAGESSNTVGFVESSFVCEFTACIEKKEYLNIPSSFHKHLIRVGHREAWVKAGGYSFYMLMKIHANKSRKANRNTRVFLVGDWTRVQGLLDLRIGDKMVFDVVSGDIGSDGCLSFNVCKLV